MTNGKGTFTNEIDFSDYDKQKDLTVMENRYDRYKDSGIAWIGKIPEHWEVRKGKNIFKLRNSKGNSNAILLAATQKYGMIPQSQIEGVVQVKQNTNLNTFKTVHKHDYVISLRSFQGGFEISEYEGVCSPAYQVFYSTIPCCNYFFKYLFKSYGFISQINAFTLGIREGKNIQYEDFSLMKLPFPVLHEQQAIADYLDRRCSEIDELIALQEEMITKLQSYKQSVITEAVTRGLDKNVPLKDSGIDWIGKIPEHWKVKRLKGIYSFGKGLNITKADLIDNGIPVISYGQLHSKLNTGTCIKDCLIRYVPEIFFENNSASLVKKGDVIFADTSEDLEGCGNCIYIDRDMLLYAGYHTIIAKNISSYHNKYFSYLFQTDCWRFQIRRMVNGVKLFSIPQRLLASTNIITPSIQEQQAIADYLDQQCSEIDELIALKQQKIEKLKEYKKSLIFECVTGKRKVS